MNPYESPPQQEPIPLADEAPLPDLEKLAFLAKRLRYLNVAAVIGLAVFLGMLIWAVLSVAPPD